MPRQSLLNELQNNAPPDLQGHPALLNAADLLETINGNLPAESPESLYRLAERIRINTIKDADDLYGITDDIGIKLQDLVASDYLVSCIEPWVSQIREELFGAPEPPFNNDLRSAVHWVESTARADESGSSKASDSAFSNPAGLSFLKRNIFFPENNTIKTVWVQPGSLLHSISRKIENISSSTGFKPHAVTVYLLTGLEPILLRIVIAVKSGRALLPSEPTDLNDDRLGRRRLLKRSLSIELHSADISPAELKNIYERYRTELKIRKTKTLSDEQVRLFYLVRKEGGPPAKGSKAFWNRIKDTWNANHENKPYKSWEGIYQRYKIVERKMDNLFIK